MIVFPDSMRLASGSLGLKEIVGRVLPKSTKYRKLSNRPKAITDDVLAVLVHEGLAYTVSTDPFEAVKQIRKAGKRIAILPLEHRKYKTLSDKVVKDVSPKNYLNMNSAPVVRRAVELSRQEADRVGREWAIPSGVSTSTITDKLVKATGMYPYFLQRAAAELRIDNPPIGYYWTGNDNRVRFTTWMRCVNGHENYLKSIKGQYYLELPKTLYAESAEIIVGSQSRPGDKNKFTMLRLPITSEENEKQYSEWMRFSVVGDVPDDIWRAKVHKQRDTENILMSSCVVSAYDGVNRRLRDKHELGVGIEIQINPFPILTANGAELVKLLKEQTLVGKRGLNMTEMDYLIGADTIGRQANTSNYDNNFVNWRAPPTSRK